MTEGGGIYYDSGRAQTRLVDPVDQLKLGIGLPELYLQTQFCAYAPGCRLYVRQCLAAIDFGLPGAKQIQIRAVQNIDNRPHLSLGKFFDSIDLNPRMVATAKFPRSILERSIAICALSSSLELYTYCRSVIDFATDLGFGSVVTPYASGNSETHVTRPKKNAESSTNNPEQLLRKMKDLP